MAIYTLPAIEFPPNGVNFFVSLPLNDSPEIWASDFVTELEAVVFFFQDQNGNFIPRDPGELVDNAHNPLFDFIISGGSGFMVVCQRTLNADAVFNGAAWCNIFDSNTETVSQCP